MKTLPLNLVVNPVSFGQVSTAILRELKNRGENVILSPIANQVDLAAQPEDPEFKEWKWEKRGSRNVKSLEGAMGQLDEIMNTHALDAEDVVHQIHMELIGNRLMLPNQLRTELLNALAECDIALRRTIHPRIQIEHFLHLVSVSGRRHGLAMN